ncbi:uveal autoantigen with coiled-coil domains and ankyrin repeats protein-like [Dysidea avara]|uniref:uveal autoantigen with coiled-coil domains and ankyrin repeats protein-like n=1 Tax=Dysidea avara TaxID=196820 RepID=UPI003327F666
MPKKKKATCTRSDNKDGSPFSRLEVYKELKTINERVEKIIANYEEFGPPTQSYITDEEVDHVRKLIEKFENVRLEKETALKTVSAFYMKQLDICMKFYKPDIESDERLLEELLKDIKHHEFQHAYDEALKGLDKLKTLITSTANLANLQLSYRPSTSDSPQGNHHEMAKLPISQEQNSHTQTVAQNAKLLRKYSTQQRDLESTKVAYNKLLQEKTNLKAMVSEVDRLKKELSQANKEVEFLQKIVDKKKTMDSAGGKMITDQLSSARLSDDQDDTSGTNSPTLPPIVTTTDKGANVKEEHRQNNVFSKSAVKKNTFTVGRRPLSNKKQQVVNPLTASINNNKKDSSTNFFTMTKFPDISHKRPSTTYKPTDPVVKLPEIWSKNTPNLSVSQESAGHNRNSSSKPQPISSEKIVETLLDLHAKDELNSQHLKNDHANILNSLVKEPVDSLNQTNQHDKAAHAIVEYTNMGQTIKEVDHIVNEQCKQENREYQWIVDKEEESKKTIIEHYSEFVESVGSAVDFVNKQLQRDGIIGSGQINGTSTDHPVAFSQISKETEGTYQDFITRMAEALTTISTSSALYLQHVNLSMIEQQKRLLVLKRANPQVYQKCIQQLDKDSQYPELISKRLHEGLGIMNGILEKHIAEMQSEIDIFMSEREQLVEEAKLQMQAHIAEIIHHADKISALLSLDENKTTSNLSTGLQTSLSFLNRLCSNHQRVQVFKEHNDRENTNKKAASFSETIKPVLKEVQSKVKDMLYKELGLRMPHQLDYKLNRKSNNIVHTTLPVLPSSNHTGGAHVPAMDSARDTSFAKTSTSNGRNNTSTFWCTSVWDTFVQSSSAEEETRSILSQGIQGKTIGKRNRMEDCQFLPLKDMRNTSNTKDNGSLQIEGHGKMNGKRRMKPQRMSITITVKNRLVRDENTPKEPVECFKVTSVDIKNRDT